MNSKTNIYLFCQYFPYYGGEQFLFNEVEFYPQNYSIKVFTEHRNEGKKIALPNNFEIINEDFKNKSSVRQIIRRYWRLILEIFIYEVFTSPHKFKYIRYFKTHFFLLIGYLQKAEIINKYIPISDDSITLYSYWFDEWAVILNLIKRIHKSKIKVVCRAHAYDFDESQVISGYHVFRSFNSKEIDNILAISNYGKMYMELKYKCTFIHVEKLGVRNHGNNPIINESPITIVSCSSLISYKRVELIIEILKQINIKVTWVHFGGGPLEASILNKAKSLPSNIIFEYKGFVKNEDIIAFYKLHTIDLLINTSELEGIPVSMMEAISFGIPIAGCNICGIPEIVNLQTGMLFEEKFNIEETAKRIQKFILSKSRDLTYREGVKSFWDENYNADKIYPQFINNYLLAK